MDMLSSQRRLTGRKLGDLPAWPLWVCHSPSEDHAGAACKAEERVLRSLGRDTLPAVTSLRGSAALGPRGLGRGGE